MCSRSQVERGMTYEELLEHAEECERLAKAARLPSNLQALLSAAKMWRRMAADTKSNDGAGLDSKIGDPRSDT